ncbi:PIR Superfamily Protein [Plasmodium ovale wallikeri]|uniref:PIR Superfamily Protein n=1 Tax=Plasmodium ovale wallikeri TaxID=864142 RepID=A0A1A9AJK3_PLAOA|nr:PIR Superfamily Protein [Plasmodium ovale wallikeri]SBT57651.1 PIR Superfamily Protein [Plasmodium ovale wallikeri]
MERSGHQERYDTFSEYNYNYDIYDKIKGDTGHYYETFPNVIIPIHTNERDSIVNDCLRLKIYLLKFGSKEKCQKKNCCAYVNYLLNEGIKNYYGSQKSIFEFYTRYMNDNSNKDIKKLCGSEIIDMDEEKYNKTKELYSLYYLYKIFNTNTRLIPECSHAKSCARKYNNIITDYPNRDDTEFCKALNDFKTVFENNTIISSQCHALYPDELSLQDTCIHLQRQSKDIDLHPQQPGGEVEQGAFGKKSFPEAQKTDRETEKQSSSPSSSGSTLPIALFSSGIGILLILLSSYKFTHFGQLLKLKMQKFKGTSDHLYDEQYEMQQNYSEYDERNAEYNGYNISYNSL